MTRARARDLLVLVDSTGESLPAIENLTFIPPLRIERLPAPPQPHSGRAEPLLYLLGTTGALDSTETLLGWLDALQAADGAPVALLLPRAGSEWCAITTHPQFCGLIPWRPRIAIGAMERTLREARQALARRWGCGALRRAKLAWTFSSREAADPEQAWHLLESALARLIGSSADLSCLGMAFGEALTNAVEHGNLELDSSLKDDSDDCLFRFFEIREERLRDPQYNRRRVRVAADLRGSRVRVRIHHEGRGFDPSTVAPAGGRIGAVPYGMGMQMIDSLVDGFTISRDGRTICLTHRLERGRVRIRGALPNLVADESPRRAAA